MRKIQNKYQIAMLLGAFIGLPAGSMAADPVANVCPVDGCQITILSIEKSGDELEIQWEANFLPDVSRNHVHVYWDTFKAEEVSSNAEANGFKQGDWVPTSDYPKYTTADAMSVANRDGSTTICVTAGGRDHAVLDPQAVHCLSASSSL
ncbi:MAG: hypothetical protein V3U65_03705 [Granulosicoccaceae bacterium]